MPVPITDVFATLSDPRLDRNRLHRLVDIVVIALCALIGGAEGWEQIAQYGRSKESFFRRFLTLANGIPSHDTFYRVFTALDPDAFSRCLGAWMAAACADTGLVPIAIDGKSARRSPKRTATGCLHLVTAWASANRVVLGQVSVAEGSHEIAAVPDLLRLLDLSGALVTLDAAHCQTATLAQIRRQEGHYLVAVKGNQGQLSEAVQAAHERACLADFAGCDAYEEIETGHGRHEERHTVVLPVPAGLAPSWPDVAAVVAVARERVVGEAVTSSLAFYLTSAAGTAADHAARVRGHWEVENGLHWVLDVAFREDESRTTAGHGGANLGLLRRVAVSLLRRVETTGSIQARRMRAGWDDDFLLNVLQAIPVI